MCVNVLHTFSLSRKYLWVFCVHKKPDVKPTYKDLCAKYLPNCAKRTHNTLSRNLSNLDTNGAEESVIASEVSSFQRLNCMQEWYLGWEKVSCSERCPQFRSVLITLLYTLDALYINMYTYHS